MTKSLIGLAAVAATIACSNTRETRIPARPPERPLEIARADTTQQDRSLARSKDTSQSVSTVEQQVTRPRDSAPSDSSVSPARDTTKTIAADTAQPVAAAASDTARPTPEPVAARPDTST